MESYPQEAITLGPFRVDVANTRLLRDGVDLELRPLAFRVLQVLVQNPGKLVDYDRIMREAWNGIKVSRHTVNVTVFEIKTALAECGYWITCRTKFGYCLEIPESEDLIRTGYHFRDQFTRSGFENALRCFKLAARNDSGDFRAFEAIARVYLFLGGMMLADRRDLYPAFLAAQERAVSLGGLTPELRLDRAYGRFIFEADPVKAESELLELQQEIPKAAEGYARLAMVYLGQGCMDKALVQIQKAHATDLLVATIAFVEVLVHLFRREFHGAVARGSEAVNLHPLSPKIELLYAEALEQVGRNEEALKHFRHVGAISGVPWIRAQEARFMATIGLEAEALRILEELQTNRATAYVDAYHLALLLFSLGRRDEAFQELERAREEKSYMMFFLHADPKADSLRSDPRYAAFRNEVLTVA